MNIRTRRTRNLMGAALALCALSVGTSPISVVRAADDKGGALDTTFNKGGAGADKEITLMAFGADDSIYIAGKFTTYNGTAVPGFARLKSDGSLDTSFNPGTAAPQKIFSLAEAADGDVYVGGNFDTFNGVAALKLVRLNKDGSVDTGFVSAGFKHFASANNSESVRTLLITSDAKVIASGQFDQYGGDYSDGGDSAQGGVKINADGTIDKTFSARFNGQSGTTAYATKMRYNADQSKITAIGSFYGYQSKAALNMTRFGNDGARDDTFTVGDIEKGPNNTISNFAPTSDGKYYVYGNYSKWFGTDVKNLIRINADGTLDTTYAGPDKAIGITTMAVDSKDRLYISGSFIDYKGTPAMGLVRLKSDGSVDTTFDTAAGAPPVTTAAVQPAYNTSVAISPAGKVYVYGATAAGLPSWGGTTIGNIGRLVPDGKPGQVSNVKVTVNGTTATVSWTLPASGGPVDSITATAAEVSSKGVRASAEALSCTVPGTATTCDIKGLVSGKKYTFSVVTSNGAGAATPAASAPTLVGEAPATSTAKPTKTTTTQALPATGSGGTTATTVVALGLLMVGCALVTRRRFARAFSR